MWGRTWGSSEFRRRSVRAGEGPERNGGKVKFACMTQFVPNRPNLMRIPGGPLGTFDDDDLVKTDGALTWQCENYVVYFGGVWF